MLCRFIVLLVCDEGCYFDMIHCFFIIFTLYEEGHYMFEVSHRLEIRQIHNI